MYYFTWKLISHYFQKSILLAAIAGSAVFLFTRTIFFEIPFCFVEDLNNLFKTIAVSWLLLIILHTGFYLLGKLLHVIAILLKHIPIRQKNGIGLVLVILTASFLFSCTQNKKGSYTNLTTGMVTSYQHIAVGQTDMVMNKEVINHRDIPLGESFEIINTTVKGLVVKEDKVAISCSLFIKDVQGNVVFNENDLFNGNGNFHKDSASYLRCTINTGSPMEWDEEYTVVTVFKDKNGKGQIENKVVIRMIDIP